MSYDPKPDPQDATRQIRATQPMPAAVPPRVRRENPFLLPLWSIALMLLGVVAVSGGIVLLVLILGGAEPTPTDPIFVIITAPPSEIPSITDTPPPPPSPVITTANDLPLPNFALEGPTLPPIFLSPTPDTISVGRMVQIINVGESGLNVRAAPGINNQLLFTARENTLHEIIAGPESAREDSFTWWQIRDPFSSETGWAVDLYMEVQPETPTP